MTHHRFQKIGFASLFLCLALSLSAHAEPGTATKADSLRVEPYADAKASGKLTRGAKVEIVAKQGAWYQIKTGKSTGWVRLLSIKRDAAGASVSGKGVLDVASGRAGTGQVVATTGVRGLSESELKNAHFNAAEIQRMESFQVSAADAKSQARAAGLQPVSVAYPAKK